MTYDHERLWKVVEAAQRVELECWPTASPAAFDAISELHDVLEGLTLSKVETQSYVASIHLWLDQHTPPNIRRQLDALDRVVQAAKTVTENDQHIDFGIDPPGWRATHQRLHAALLDGALFDDDRWIEFKSNSVT